MKLVCIIRQKSNYVKKKIQLIVREEGWKDGRMGREGGRGEDGRVEGGKRGRGEDGRGEGVSC